MSKQNLDKRMKPVKKLQPKERLSSITQKTSIPGNRADESLSRMLQGNVGPGGKKVTRPTGANKDRRNS